MFEKYTTYIFLAVFILSGLIGFGLNQDNKRKIAALEVAPTIESEIVIQSSEVEPAPKSSTEPSEAEKERAYEDSLLAVLPTSLIGVPAPSSLDVDAAGNLVINTKIRKMFDHYLSTLGEEDSSKTIDRIKLLLERQLSDPALAQALRIFDNYIQYKGAIDGILQQSAQFQSGQYDAQTIGALKEQIRVERQNYFSQEVIEAFFAREDQYDNYMLSRSLIVNDQAISNEEKDLEISRLNQNSPAWVRQQGRNASVIDSYKAQEKALIESGAQDWEINDFRRRELGENIAKKLKLRDQRRADWTRRLSTYQEAVRDAMTQYDDLNSAKAIAARDKIRAEHFKDNELRRVKSLDSIQLIE